MVLLLIFCTLLSCIPLLTDTLVIRFLTSSHNRVSTSQSRKSEMSFDPVNGAQMRQSFDFDFDLLDKLLQGINKSEEEQLLAAEGSNAMISNPVPGTVERNLRLGSEWLRQLDQDMVNVNFTAEDDNLSISGQSVSSSPAPGGNFDDFFDQEWSDISSFFTINSISPSPSPQDFYADPFAQAKSDSSTARPSRSAEALALNQELQSNLRSTLERLSSLNHQQHELARITSLLQKQTDKRFKRKKYNLPFWPHQIPSLTLLNKVVQDAHSNNNSETSIVDPRLANLDEKLRKYYTTLRTSPRWTYKERTFLAHGVRSQNEKILLGIIQEKGTHSLEECRNIISSFGEIDMLMNVNGIDWETIAKVFVPTRSPFDCRLQWTIIDHPMINKTQLFEGNDEEIEKLKTIVPKAFKQINNSKGGLLPDGFCSPWQLIASQLGTNRTAIQCFIMYQRRINPNFLKGKWTPEEDKMLVDAVKIYGTQNWQCVAQMMDGRTGQQCLHRYEKAINPEIKRGRWDKNEDELLKRAVEPFLTSNSKKIIWSTVRLSVPGRTDVQCRERWVNVLDPSILAAPFSASEDSELLKLVEINGTGNWSKISHEFSTKRTDNQLWRRWKQISKSKRSGKQRKYTLKKRKIQ